jgi:hypothetical protein
MTTGDLINIVLLLLVVRQVRERRQDMRALLLPVVLVGAAAAYYLRSIPTGGNDVALVALCASLGVIMGGLGAALTHLRRDGAGVALARAGWAAASLWVVGVGARMAFAYAAEHGAGPSIGRFSLAHHITGANAWIAALVLMALADVLTRLLVVRLRAARLPGAVSRPESPAVVAVHS